MNKQTRVCAAILCCTRGFCVTHSNFDILFHATYVRSHHPTSSLLQSAKASKVPLLILRTTVPLVSYIRNSLRFWYYASLSTCCQNLGKIGITGKILGEIGGFFFLYGTKTVQFYICNVSRATEKCHNIASLYWSRYYRKINLHKRIVWTEKVNSKQKRETLNSKQKNRKEYGVVGCEKNLVCLNLLET